jgi:hypothetical protein
MCGARADAQAQPGYGQPYQPPQPMAQPGYGQPYPPPLAQAVPPPSRGLVMTAGIIAIVFASIYLLLFVLGTIGNAANDEPNKGASIVVGILLVGYWAFGLIAGIYTVKGRWWGAMVTGILQTIVALGLLLFYLAIGEAEDQAGFAAEIARDEIGLVKTILLVWLLITIGIAVINFVAISAAKKVEQYASRSHLRAADQF